MYENNAFNNNTMLAKEQVIVFNHCSRQRPSPTHLVGYVYELWFGLRVGLRLRFGLGLELRLVLMCFG